MWTQTKTCIRCGASFELPLHARGGRKLCERCRYPHTPRTLSADPVNVRRREKYAEKRQRQIGGEG